MNKKPFYIDYTQRLNRFDFSNIFREANKNIYEEISKYKQLNIEFINIIKELEILVELYSLEESYEILLNKYKIYKLKFETELEETFKNLKILSEIILRLDNKKFQKNFSETLLKLNNLTLDMEDKNKYFMDIDDSLNLLKQLNNSNSNNLTLTEIKFLIGTLTKVETVTDYFIKHTESKFFGNKPTFDVIKPKGLKPTKEKEENNGKEETEEDIKKTYKKEPNYMSELEDLLDKWKTD